MKKILKLKKLYFVIIIILALSMTFLSLSFLPRITVMAQELSEKKEQNTTVLNSRKILDYGENQIVENDIVSQHRLNPQQSMTNNYQKTLDVIENNNFINDNQLNIQEEFNLLVDEIEM